MFLILSFSNFFSVLYIMSWPLCVLTKFLSLRLTGMSPLSKHLRENLK